MLRCRVKAQHHITGGGFWPFLYRYFYYGGIYAAFRGAFMQGVSYHRQDDAA